MDHPDPSDVLRARPAQWLWPEPVQAWFPSPQPLEVDVGSGKGRYLLARAAACPGRNFLGIDRMVGRVRKVCRKAWARNLRNLRILRMDAAYAVTHLLPDASVSRYTVFFPDPWPKKRHHGHRLVNGVFLDAVARTLGPGGELFLATDHADYFQEMTSLLDDHPAFTTTAPYRPTDEETTEFEQITGAVRPVWRAGYLRV